MSPDAIRATLAQWDFAVASQGFRRRESVVSPLDQNLPRVSSNPSLRRESSSQQMETDDPADDYFPRFNSSIGNSFLRPGTHWPSLMSTNKDEEILNVTRQTIPGHNLLPFPNTQAASDLEILNFYVEEPDTVYLEVRFPNMQPIILREENVQKINEPAVINFWRLSGSREYATGIGKRHVFFIIGYRVFYLPNGGEREEHWIHWTGYRASEASWVESDFARRAAPEMVRAFNSERRLSCYRDSTGEMFITKTAPRCSEMTKGTTSNNTGNSGILISMVFTHSRRLLTLTLMVKLGNLEIMFRSFTCHLYLTKLELRETPITPVMLRLIR
ncbi:hypothetical protein H9Q73_004778 [Fusarium xylarioides]|nr:hypothetical protein H9Q73_004778 [Fusarium xylarioides]